MHRLGIRVEIKIKARTRNVRSDGNVEVVAIENVRKAVNPVRIAGPEVETENVDAGGTVGVAARRVDRKIVTMIAAKDDVIEIPGCMFQ